MTDQIPFSRLVKVEPLPRGGLEQTIEATAPERDTLAKLNNLVEIASLKVAVSIKKSGKGVRVAGELVAEITQTCVVSLDPFPAEIREEIDVKFAPEASKPPAKRGRAPGGAPDEIDLSMDDEPDPIVDGKIDLGLLASEFLTLALDPYPRKPDVAFDAPAAETPDSPFAALVIKKP